MLREKDILYSTDKHYVIACSYGYEVYRNEVTHAVRCARIGYKEALGLDRAINEIKRREA